MPQITRCPHCSTPLQVPDDVAGKPIRCPKCQQLFAIRAPTRPSTPANGQAATTPPVTRTPPAPTGPTCPACQSRLTPGSTLCSECGYILQSTESSQLETEVAPNLCPNPACGVANPPKERLCQRCGYPLPMEAGTRLGGRYRIEKLLAIGGFAAVYLATDMQSGRTVAVKDMLSPDANEFAIRLGFFRREAEILKSLAHVPAVPRFFDFLEQGQSAYLVLEYIPGQDLQKLLEATDGQPFDFNLVVEWGKSICDVLASMHSQTPPLVHRDVKPENIMLMEDRRSIKMIDFGTARDMGKSQQARMASKTRVYTEGYAPPEQILGKPEVRSDLFALAGTLYQLATGKTPEGQYTARELEKQLEDPQGLLPQDQRWFYELIRINLAEDVHERYFSSTEIKQDLERREVTREVSCSQCGQSVPVRQPFCLHCAAPLTPEGAACGHCQKLNRLGSRCCIYCGNRLR